ncbi:MAG: glycosyl transferase family 1 [Bacteroidetes bacterium]|nr:MAG: glycosyl transferase family 1 [Bacteroidota bacterium]
MKKILIITYYWPPSGGSGVQRWLKFVKYLTKNNYHCIVYTPRNPEIPVIDHSLEKDIPNQNFELIKTKILEPYLLYKLFTGKSSKDKITVSFLNEKQKTKSLTEKISQWIRGNIFIPDAKILWIKPSVKILSTLLKTNKIDVIISTGPPHSLHIIALKLKQQFPDIKWIADFRDPWTNIDFLNELQLTSYALQQHKNLEKKVVQTADRIISVSPTLTKELSLLDPSNKEKFFTITNGFDEDDYINIPPAANTNKNFIITHAGLIPSNRNPQVLWKALFELRNENKLPENLKIQLIGKTDALIMEEIKKHQLEKYIEKLDYLPHSEVIKAESNANVLLLIINNAPNSKGIITGKLFEYLALQKPIIAIGPPDGDAAKIIHQTHSGIIIDYDDVEGMKNALLKLFFHPITPTRKEDILPFSRRVLTHELIKIIEKL